MSAMVLVLAATACAQAPPALPRHATAPSPRLGRGWTCPRRLTPEAVDEAIALGTSFMLNNQRPEGNFAYEYDWQQRSDSDDDSSVRQAGAGWGLALLWAAAREPRLERATLRALAFFRQHSREANGKRWVVYPGQSRGTLGTVALAGLANLQAWSSLDRTDGRRAELLDDLDGYLGMLLAARRDDGRFHGHYAPDAGEPFGAPSPYYDGEALLLLVEAARRLGRADLRDAALVAADAGYRLNVRQALADDPDSDVTKGYYQWSSMAYHALARSGWPHTRRYGDRLLELADWMVDVHRTLDRQRNTAYAYEGIVPAYAWAREQGDTRKAKLGCVIEEGLARLMSWQVGSPRANSVIAAQPTDDPRAIGGVQNHPSEPALRIDVTQHQLHALLLARELYLDE